MKKEFFGPNKELNRSEEYEYREKLPVRMDLTYFTNGVPRPQAIEYTGELLTNITEEDRDRKRITTLEYDSDNRLIRKLQNGNVTQENTWSGDRLIQRDEFYLGFDPCRDLCCGKNRLMIEYY